MIISKLPKRISWLTVALFINKHYWVIAAIVVVTIGGIMAFPLSYISNLNVLLGICLIPLCLSVRGKQRLNYLFLIAVLFFGATAAFYSVKIFYFFAIAFFILLLLEIHVGKISPLILFLLAFMSPFFEQVAGILGFPIRIQLSSLAGSMLQAAGLDVVVQGNMMTLNGNSFTVDDACMGLNMLSTSLLMGVLMMAYHFRRSKKLLSIFPLVCFFLSIFLLNLICNLTRIVILVMFNIGPQHVLHDIAGLVSLLVYAVVPAYFLAGWITQRFGTDSESVERSYRRTSVFAKSGIIVLATAILWIGVNFNEQRLSSMQHASVPVPDIPGLKTTQLQDGVAKISNSEVLIYLKPIAEFFSGEHTPLFCWKGSGYQFAHIRTTTIGGHQIYCGQMIKPEGKLWTAWWYSNGEVKTIDQFDWRFRMMKGEPSFYLVNVTASEEATMIKYATSMLSISTQTKP